MASVMLSPPQFSDQYEHREYLKGRLAIALRIFGRNGYEEGAAGHITVRDPVLAGHFWVNPLGIPFGYMKKSDLILVNDQGIVVDGGKHRLLNKAAYMIHSQIHAARPDVVCAAHSHSVHGRAFSTLGRELDIITQDACAFYRDHAVYASFRGVVLSQEEGQNIARALGQKKAVILQNHGLLTVGPTVEACIYWYTSLENSCRVQLLADAAAAGRGGTTIKIDEQDAALTYQTAGSQQIGWHNGLMAFNVVEREAGPEVLD